MFGTNINELGKTEKNAKVKEDHVLFLLNINGKLMMNVFLLKKVLFAQHL